MNFFKLFHKIDDLTPRIVILKFFATGGKVKYKEAQDRTGLTYKDLLGFVSKNGLSYHSLVIRAKEYSFNFDADEPEILDMIDEIIQGGRVAVYDELRQYLEVKEKYISDAYKLIKQINEELKQKPVSRITKNAKG